MHYLKQILHQTKQTSIVIVGHHFADNIYEICTQYENDIFLVADKNTAELLNKNILNKTPNLIISGNSTASLDITNSVRNKVEDSGLIVAFGSGTVNDVCKYASYLEGKKFISFPTAASMNGYTSANASILVDGYKNRSKHIFLRQYTSTLI